MSSNYIVLRNCPKTELIIDMIPIEIEGGFRGIKHLTPGLHYISVKNNGGDSSCFWTMIDVEDEYKDTVVKIFDSKNSIFIDDTLEDTERYSMLAQSGQMDDDMVSYPYKESDNWFNHTGSIKRWGKMPKLHLDSNSEKSTTSPFRHFVEVLHDEELVSALAEFQFAFVRMLVSTLGEKDPDAFTRWQEIIDIVYNATLEEINEHDEFVISWIGRYIKQLEELPDSIFEENGDSEMGNVVVAEVAPFVKNLVDSGDKDLRIQGLRLAKYFTQRGYRV